MKSKNITNWFFEDPIDFESKKYRLYHNADLAKKMLDKGSINEAMSFIEDHLVCFYKFKTEKEIFSGDDREIIGIDPILMNLVFEPGQKDQSRDIEILSDIAELGVLEFEALHSIFRIKWRDIDDTLKLNYIPEKTHFINDGFIFLSDLEQNWTRLYTFKNPTGVDDWVDFKIDFSSKQEYNHSQVIDFIKNIREAGSEAIIFNVVINKQFDSISAVEFVLACKVYYKLLKDYMF
tara:strand:- start:1038 stop:1742 length:705 start_codon:yes stop_codon:yes gene_type:complete